MSKQQIMKLVNELLDYANQRTTEQGVIVYKSVLEKLSIVDNNIDILDVLERLNSVLAKIESYGEFTDDEFKIVVQLREIEKNMVHPENGN